MIERPACLDARETELSWCACCGEVFFPTSGGILVEGWNAGALETQGRCRVKHHVGRNPCAIAGCTRTTAATHGYALDQWLCSVHWRAYVPPRSPERLAYHRIWRLAKRRGWDEHLKRRFWRLWAAIVARARRRHGSGHLDIAEIDRFLARL